MLAANQRDGGASFDQDQDLGGGVGGGKKSDWLLGTVVEDMEILLLQAFNEFAVHVDDAGIDFDKRDTNFQRSLGRGCC